MCEEPQIWSAKLSPRVDMSLFNEIGNLAWKLWNLPSKTQLFLKPSGILLSGIHVGFSAHFVLDKSALKKSGRFLRLFRCNILTYVVIFFSDISSREISIFFIPFLSKNTFFFACSFTIFRRFPRAVLFSRAPTLIHYHFFFFFCHTS